MAGIAASLALLLATPDAGYVDRLETLALVEQLNGELLASRSATLTLEHWCGLHRMADPPKLVAIRDRDAVKPAPPEVRARLKVSAGEPLVYRRVRLTCGVRVMSEADNWYVPARLTAEMNAALDRTDTPFGKVVLSLGIQRQTLGVERLWSPLPGDWAEAATPTAGSPAPRLLFRHRAVLVTPAGLPIAEVVETYTRDVLDFPRHGAD